MAMISASLAAENPAGLDRIAAYAGTWKIETENLATPFSKAGKESSTLRNECWRNGAFYVCDQFVNGESKALVIFTEGADAATYNSYSVPADGGKAGPGGKLLISGNTWTFPWEYERDGKTVHFHVVNVFSTPKTIEFRREFSEDNEHWTVMARGHETKEK